MRHATPQEVRNLTQALHEWRARRGRYHFPGGLPALRHKQPPDFDPHQLAIGTTVELEHTRQPAVALEIAMAHLIEDPRYYEKLERMGL